MTTTIENTETTETGPLDEAIAAFEALTEDQRPRIAVTYGNTMPNVALALPQPIEGQDAVGIVDGNDNWEIITQHHSFGTEINAFVQASAGAKGVPYLRGVWINPENHFTMWHPITTEQFRTWLSEGVDALIADVVTEIRSDTRALEERVLSGLRSQQAQRGWCDELESWLSSMGLPLKGESFPDGTPAPEPQPQYLRFEVEVEVTGTFSFTRDEEVVVVNLDDLPDHIDRDDEDEVRQYAEELARQRVRQDVRTDIDVGGQRYMTATLEVDDADASASDDGQPCDEDGDLLDY